MTIHAYFAGTLQPCVPAVSVRVCRNGVPAAKYLPERRSAAFPLHYSTASKEDEPNETVDNVVCVTIEINCQMPMEIISALVVFICAEIGDANGSSSTRQSLIRRSCSSTPPSG